MYNKNLWLIEVVIVIGLDIESASMLN